MFIGALLTRVFRSKGSRNEPCVHRSDVPQQTPENEVVQGEGCLQCKAEKRAASKYRWKLVLCLLMPYSLQALDVTMYAIFDDSIRGRGLNVMIELPAPFRGLLPTLV